MRADLCRGLIVFTFVVACGSSDSTSSPSPRDDAGAQLPTVDAGDASALDGAKACGWTLDGDGLAGATIVDVLFDTRAMPGLVYATGGDAIYQSGDGGQTWHQQGTFAGGSIGFLSAPGTAPGLLLATSGGGVLESTDTGKTWSVISLEGVAVESIAAAPSQPLRVYVGVTGVGLLRSDDGGNTWSPANQGYPSVATLAIDVAPDNPDDVVAGGPSLNPQEGWSPDGVVMHSTDGGQTWQTVVPGDGNVYNIRRCVTDPTVLYAATGAGVARSSDGGNTWALLPLDVGVVEDVAVNPGDCDDFYAMVQNDGPHHSTDGGQTFGPTLTLGLDFETMGTWPGRMAVDPTKAAGVVLGSHAGVWYTANSGGQWNGARGILGLGVRSLGVSPVDPGRVWLASWGSGVWQRSGNQAWQRVPAATLPVDYTFAVAPDPVLASRVFVGASQTLYGSSNGGTTFAAASVNENEFAFAFDPTDSNVVYVATQENGAYKSADGGTTWASSNGTLKPWATAAGTFIDTRSVIVDPASSQIVYLGTNGQGLYKSTDSGASWSNVLAPADLIPCLLFAAGTPETLYACDTGSGVQSSTDGGTHWMQVNDGLGTLDVTGLALDDSTGALYAASTLGVYVMRGGQAWAALDASCWPGGPAAAEVIVSGSQASLVVAAAGGVYTHSL